jgi:hypothetical protein
MLQLKQTKFMDIKLQEVNKSIFSASGNDNIDQLLSASSSENSSTSSLAALSNMLTIPCALSWDIALSNFHLEFGESNQSCRRPGSASCYPAAFAALPSATRSCFRVTLTEARSTTNWLSIGICNAGFQTSSSDGFGRTSKSW